MCKGTKKNNNKYYPRFKIMYKYVYMYIVYLYIDACCREQLQMSFMPVNSGSHLFHGVSIVRLLSLMMERDNVPFSIAGLLFFFLQYKNKNRKKFSFLFPTFFFL